MFTPSDIENLKLIYHLVKEKGMTLEGANLAMKRRGKSVKRDVSILERLQNIRAMLLEIRETLGDDSPVEYEAPIEAMAELITDVESAAKADVVEGVTTPTSEETVVESVEPAEAVVEAEPRRRGRPRKQETNEADSEAMQSVTRRRTKSKKGEEKELFPFYEQSLF